jgi:hypothetical protein
MTDFSIPFPNFQSFDEVLLALDSACTLIQTSLKRLELTCGLSHADNQERHTMCDWYQMCRENNFNTVKTKYK